MIMSSDLDNNHLKDDREDFQPLDGLRILVVDDDVDNCVLFAFILESYGVQVMTSESAIEALEILQQFEPNVLISDIAMPEVDGCSFIRRVRTLNPPLGEIPAIAITAMCTEEDRNFALKSGFQSYLSKPVEPTDLATEIVKIITLNLIND
ncbi:hypothetical protein PCC6912_25680 [Chlorogloeopsis fritschii PCC 6912]|uniref:Response regulatory domain-containing protein n=2 Tax=Chlorogloeopsis fritschii TaxID=1124 RepID=A0A433NKH7_CHLFR|nr:hypothetical protein PCC6912_25680 [Chlorogloeopsis fritschii PCC 6912]